MAERQGFEPWRPFWGLRTFQARSFGQLGHLSVKMIQADHAAVANIRLRIRNSTGICSMIESMGVLAIERHRVVERLRAARQKCLDIWYMQG
jgi:hypothetical protein